MRDFFNQLTDAKMHAGDLVQLSCLLAIYPPNPEQSTQDSFEAHLAHYWSASRDRIDRWQFYLYDACPSRQRSQKRKKKTGVDSVSSPRTASLSLAVPLIAEMIVSEPLARVWAALLSDSTHLNPHCYAEFGNVAEHIVGIHSTLRKDTLKQLKHIVTDPGRQAYLESLASRTLRWTDLLIAHIEQSHSASRFAPNPKRCLEFAEDLQMQMESQQQHTAVLTIASARQAICEELPTCAFSEQLNFKIGSAVLQSCGSNDLDILGLLDPLWTTRLFATLAHCEGLLEESLND